MQIWLQGGQDFIADQECIYVDKIYSFERPSSLKLRKYIFEVAYVFDTKFCVKVILDIENLCDVVCCK